MDFISEAPSYFFCDIGFRSFVVALVRDDEDFDGFLAVLSDLGFQDVDLFLEDVIESSDKAPIGGHDEVLISPIDVEEYITGPSAGAGLLQSRSRIADSVTEKRSR